MSAFFKNFKLRCQAPKKTKCVKMSSCNGHFSQKKNTRTVPFCCSQICQNFIRAFCPFFGIKIVKGRCRKMIVKPEPLNNWSLIRSFHPYEEFDHSHEKNGWLDYEEVLTKAELIGFLQLICSSKKIPGVCWTIANDGKSDQRRKSDERHFPRFV